NWMKNEGIGMDDFGKMLAEERDDLIREFLSFDSPNSGMFDSLDDALASKNVDAINRALKNNKPNTELPSDLLELPMEDLFTMRKNVDDIHRNQRAEMIGGLFDIGEATKGMTKGQWQLFDAYIKRLGFSLEDVEQMSGDMQKQLLDSFRASTRRGK